MRRDGITRDTPNKEERRATQPRRLGEEANVPQRVLRFVAAGVILFAICSAPPAAAQKAGGILQVYTVDSPASILSSAIRPRTSDTGRGYDGGSV